jgi:hypothetical protein
LNDPTYQSEHTFKENESKIIEISAPLVVLKCVSVFKPQNTKCKRRHLKAFFISFHNVTGYSK